MMLLSITEKPVNQTTWRHKRSKVRKRFIGSSGIGSVKRRLHPMEMLALLVPWEMARRALWEGIPLGPLLLFGVALFLFALMVLTAVFYISGLIVVGKRRARLSDAFIISLLGTIIFNVCAVLIPILGLPIALVVWLALIKHYYETGWLGALAVAVLAVIVYFVVFVLLAILLSLPLLLWRLFHFPFI